MSSFPMPPGYKPPLEHVPDSGHEVSLDEVSLILRKCLHPKNHRDINILKFINEYLYCRDAAQASKSIGLLPRQGKAILSMPDVANAINEITEKAVIKYGYDAAEIVEKMKEIAFVDPADLEREDGTLYESFRQIPPEVRRAIKSFKWRNEYSKDPNGMDVVTGKLISVEFHDKMKAGELLGREKKIFKEQKSVEHDIGRNMADTLLESARRAERVVAELEAPIDITPKE